MDGPKELTQFAIDFLTTQGATVVGGFTATGATGWSLP